MIYKYKKILIASNNKGKVKEITSLLSNLDIEVISPQIFNLEEPIENGNNFCGFHLIDFLRTVVKHSNCWNGTTV